MAKISPEDLKVLKEEIRIAEQFNHKELKPCITRSIERYLGKYVPAWASDWTLVLNEVFPVIQYMLPAIFFRTPRAFLKPRNKTFIKKVPNPDGRGMIEVEADSNKAAKTQEAIINYIINEIDYKGEVRKTLLDSLLFPYGIMWHGYKGNFGMTDEQSMYVKDESIFVQRISPLRFVYDPCCSVSELDKCQWVSRIIDVKHKDLVADKSLNIDKSQLKGFKGYGSKNGSFIEGFSAPAYATSPSKNLLDYAADWFKGSSSSDFVRLYEVYIRPNKAQREKGEKGKIILLNYDQKEPLRENDWDIKAEGFPAMILEFNPVPDQKFGISDLDVYGEIADQKNAIVNLQLRNAEELTKTYTVINRSESSEEDIEKISSGENTILTYEGEKSPNQKMAIMSANPGSSQELYIIDQRIQKNLEDKSGVSDLNRGFLQSGEESAASVKLRSAGGGARPAYRQDLMADFLRKSIHYINQLNKQYLTVEDAVRIQGTFDIEWSDDPDIDDLQADTDVEIDVVSMLPESPEAEAAKYNNLLQLVVGGMSNPVFSQTLAKEGMKFNYKPIIEQILLRQRIKDPNIFEPIPPEDSQGFVSVAEIRAAEANVQAIMQGQEPPSPPEFGQDHLARIEIYKGSAIIAAQSGNEQLAQILQQMIEVQAQVFEEEEKQTTSKVGTRVS